MKYLAELKKCRCCFRIWLSHSKFLKIAFLITNLLGWKVRAKGIQSFYIQFQTNGFRPDYLLMFLNNLQPCAFSHCNAKHLFMKHFVYKHSCSVMLLNKYVRVSNNLLTEQTSRHENKIATFCSLNEFSYITLTWIQKILNEFKWT